ncbi:MAG: TraR/DksA family transcriptional regulator [Acidobacteria bacterium]|nr:TraR/DksA family transcriptional regulator [Acidobacteriota bacterium]
MATATKRTTGRRATLARSLRAQRAELLRHLRTDRQNVLVEAGPEDEGGRATRTLLEDLAVGTLERTQQLLREVETALERLEEGRYGVCESCEASIPERRLRALPWTRFCLECADRRQRHAYN